MGYVGLPSLSRLVLFDIDGTLLTFHGSSPGPGRTALNRAMLELHGVERATEQVRVAGRTDLGLARELLSRASLPSDDAAMSTLLESYLVHLRAVLETRSYHAIGDVRGMVAALRERSVMVGLATGNMRRGAEIKLSSAGLASTFSLEHGGFGSDAEARADIVRHAIARCAPGAATVVVVGDTKHDVAAGRAVNARVVGVAATAEARDELTAAGADAIVEACGDALLREVLA
jgi:phosphoglycolate phosphatase